ncbi:MAG: bifunctional nuclease family protein [Methylacidiphilales bacterium]|nr:bifunctional nuclease family protein [Candidatus Methylacidiphilales bacterium]
MPESLIEVKILGLVPSNTGIAVFLGNGEKTFSIHVDHGVGTNIALLLRGEKRERPLTHDLISLILQAFSITVERIVINDLRNDTYFARITLRAENEIQKRITEIDARPSDCLAIALEAGKKIFVAPRVWNQVTDITSLFEQMKEKLEQAEEEDPSEDDDEPKK